MPKFLLTTFILCFFLMQGCTSTDEKKEATKEEARPKGFSDAAFLDITPLTDGGAYANGQGGGLWYLRGSEAVKVVDAPSFIDNIAPLADGGAYAYILGGGVWYLRGGSAGEVKEVNQLSTQPTSKLNTDRERALWVLLQHERSKKKSAEEERDDYAARSEDNEPPPEDDY